LINDSDEETVWIRRDDIGKLDPEIQKLYVDYCIEEEGWFGCPKSFNQPSMLCLVNHSDTPNAYYDADFDCYAMTDIRKGEEVTLDYNKFPRYRGLKV
jgi:hypothetical protein